MHGDTCEALRDLTGGAVEKLQWQLAASSASSGTTASAVPAQQQKGYPAAVAVQAGDRVVAAAGEGAGISRPRVSGWGASAGTTPPLGWVFEQIRDRLLDHVLGCRYVLLQMHS